MVASVREQFNRAFTPEKYQAFLRDIRGVYPGSIEFRVAETPLFVSLDFQQRMTQACESILDVILQPDFKKKTDRAIPRRVSVPGENEHCEFIVFDFAVCTDEVGELIPKLIELQGFPSMNAFQVLLADHYRKHFVVPRDYGSFPNGYDQESYWQLLREITVGNHDPAEVILLEVKPHEQKTRIDFYLTEDRLGIRPVCITDLIRKGRHLFYRHQGKEIPVKRIYNRVIFDDLMNQKKILGKTIDLTRHLEVEWSPHPNWFYRISKFMLPLLQSAFVPQTYYLNELPVIPADLENYVLKPLFSFAGQGVLIDVKKEDLENIQDPHHWILQKKVQYAPVVQTPEGPAKCEIRIMYFWSPGAARPVQAQSLARLSKGKMVGVRYNADKKWVGASACFFER